MKNDKDWFYKSVNWKKCRDAYYNSVYGLCELCNGAGKIVHHIIPLSLSNINNPDIATNFNNLQLLCLECHNKIHMTTEKKYRVSFDDNGNVIPRQ